MGFLFYKIKHIIYYKQNEKRCQMEYNFRKDLGHGKKSEEVFASLLQDLLYTNISFNDDNKYDIKATRPDGSKQITFEVKTDFGKYKGKFTGNVALEYECRGKPSGITTTEADFYVYRIHEPNGEINFYFAKVEDVKKMIERKLYTRIANGGDPGSNSMNFLFTLEKFKTVFELVPGGKNYGVVNG
jgi:hypothetical protein